MVGVSGFEPEAVCAQRIGFRPIIVMQEASGSFKNRKKDSEPAKEDSESLVGVSGFEPEASWTRTKRDTKLRHTPITMPLY